MPLTVPTLSIVDNAAPATGVVATVAGSDPSSVNTLSWVRSDPGLYVPTWVTGNSVSGNGTISQTLSPGLYWFKVDSVFSNQTAASQPVQAGVTDGRVAVEEACIQGVVAGLQSLITNGNIPLISSVNRIYDMTELDLNKVDLPAIAVCTQLTGAQGVELQPGGPNPLDDIAYPIYVVFLDRVSGGYIADRGKYLLARQQIFRYFRRQRLPAAPSVYLCDDRSGPILQFMQKGSLEAMGSVMILWFLSREPRG